MRINITNSIIAVGAGVLDEVVEGLDKTGPGSFRGIRDWSRVGATLAGFAGQFFDILPIQTEALAQSYLPLLTKSVFKAIKTRTGKAQTTTRPQYGRIPVSSRPSGAFGQEAQIVLD